MQMPTRTLTRFALAAAVLAAAGTFGLSRPPLSAQSLTYSKGQNVAPAFEGWDQDADGSKYFLFGYMNRNWEEEIDLPVGPENSIAPGNPDQGRSAPLSVMRGLSPRMTPGLSRQRLPSLRHIHRLNRTQANPHEARCAQPSRNSC